MYTVDELLKLAGSEQYEHERVISLCGLSENEEYTEEQVDLYRELLMHVREGKTDEEIIGLLGAKSDVSSQNQNPKRKRSSSKRTSKKVSKSLDVSKLLDLAGERVGKISLAESLKLFEACGLSADQEEYTQAECDVFLKACELFKLQGQSLEEIAVHFGVGDSSDEELDNELEDIASSFGGSEGVIDAMMHYKASEDAQAAPNLYLKHLASEFSSPEFQFKWKRMEEIITAKIAGKKSIQNQSLLRSQKTLRSLPPTSEDGSIPE